MIKLIIIAALGIAQWIAGNTTDIKKPAPVLEKTFMVEKIPAEARLDIAVAGWCEVQVNGVKTDDRVLLPVTCQPDKRNSIVNFNIANMLKQGENTISVILGNGWQNAQTKTSWGFHGAPWIAEPMIRGKLTIDGREVLVTDDTWVAYDSPIIFNQLRNGEWYDARKEGKRQNLRKAKKVTYIPWGAVSVDDSAPCKAFDTFEPKNTIAADDGGTIYDFRANIAGWCEIEVEGEMGAKVIIDYDESLSATNKDLSGYIAVYIKKHKDPNPVQHDEYTLSGKGVEKWHPRFTYHGFRYAKVKIVGKAELKSIKARFVHSDFPQVGSFTTANEDLSWLQRATIRSYLSNFTGIPTDCPHREKNGWTGDAQLACETGMWNFDAKAGYLHFLRMMMDAQRPNGAVPCIIPASPTFGFFWGSGPAWDAILFEIPREIYRFYGDDAPAREAFDTMVRYYDFISAKVDKEGILAYGLGDWCYYRPSKDDPKKNRPMAKLGITDTAYLYHFTQELADWSARFGKVELARTYKEKAAKIREDFNRAFYKGDGLYGTGIPAELAAPLYFKGLAADGSEYRAAERLVEVMRNEQYHSVYGILGAKWVPRVLADYGYIEDAWKLFTQPEMPGWMHWKVSGDGDGTLRENWNDSYSHNHIMFGDTSAWFYEYLGGVKIVEPGFKKVEIKPYLPEGLDNFTLRRQTPYGEIFVSAKRVNGKPEFVIRKP